MVGMALRADVPGQVARGSTLVAYSARTSHYDGAGHLNLITTLGIRPQLWGQLSGQHGSRACTSTTMRSSIAEEQVRKSRNT